MNVKPYENNEGKGPGALLVLRVNLRMFIRVCLKNLKMNYTNTGERSYLLAENPLLGPKFFGLNATLFVCVGNRAKNSVCSKPYRLL